MRLALAACFADSMRWLTLGLLAGCVRADYGDILNCSADQLILLLRSTSTSYANGQSFVELSEGWAANFTITPEGLQEQLLSTVVGKVP